MKYKIMASAFSISITYKDLCRESLPPLCFIPIMLLIPVCAVFTTMTFITYFSIDFTDYTDPHFSLMIHLLLVLEVVSLVESVLLFIYTNNIRHKRREDKNTKCQLHTTVVSGITTLVLMLGYSLAYSSITTDLKAISPWLNAAAVFWYYATWVVFVFIILVALGAFVFQMICV
eukprot:gnl/Dysnectes_brevis/3894_a5040_810.p1 GENE.gnl/Dysnectes_brevis/3894_a5040_810~~gnl/Dysnectes_brevis/3894_a5040_810.p1  ORF type:complete len:174 (+),score=4.98 gnl/Dysnectes_brevis/3894_a5040_810:56-577(+)